MQLNCSICGPIRATANVNYRLGALVKSDTLNAASSKQWDGEAARHNFHSPVKFIATKLTFIDSEDRDEGTKHESARGNINRGATCSSAPITPNQLQNFRKKLRKQSHKPSISFRLVLQALEIKILIILFCQRHVRWYLPGMCVCVRALNLIRKIPIT